MIFDLIKKFSTNLDNDSFIKLEKIKNNSQDNSYEFDELIYYLDKFKHEKNLLKNINEELFLIQIDLLDLENFFMENLNPEFNETNTYVENSLHKLISKVDTISAKFSNILEKLSEDFVDKSKVEKITENDINYLKDINKAYSILINLIYKTLKNNV